MTIRPDAFSDQLRIVSVTATTWALTMSLSWTGTKGEAFVVPAGFVTDFATIPRFLHWEVSPYGAYTRAAVLHDWLLVELAAWTEARAMHSPGSGHAPQPPANSRDCDGIFRRVMEDLGVPWAKRWTMWAAVRWASLFNSRRAYGRGFLRDLPAVLGMTVIALPVSLPGVIGVLISLGLLKAGTVLARIGRA